MVITFSGLFFLFRNSSVVNDPVWWVREIQYAVLVLQKGPLAISMHISQVLGKVIEGLHYTQSRACYNFLIQFNLLPGWPPVYKQLTIYSLWNWFPGIVEGLLGLQMTDVCWSSQCCCSTEMRENLPHFSIFCKLLNLLLVILGMKLSLRYKHHSKRASLIIILCFL